MSTSNYLKRTLGVGPVGIFGIFFIAGVFVNCNKENSATKVQSVEMSCNGGKIIMRDFYSNDDRWMTSVKNVVTGETLTVNNGRVNYRDENTVSAEKFTYDYSGNTVRSGNGTGSSCVITKKDVY